VPRLDTRDRRAENPGVLRFATLVPLFAVMLAIGAAACRRGIADEVPCSAVAARFLDLARTDLAGAKLDDAMTRAVTDQLPAMRDSLTQACTDGHWSAAARNCLVHASDRVGFEACQQQLTDEQRRDLDLASRGTPRSP
jgi:hypothetical protein